MLIRVSGGRPFGSARKRVAAALGMAAAIAALTLPGAEAGAPASGAGGGGVTSELVEDGFDSPVYVTTAPGVGGVQYVVEQDGLVQVVVGGVTQPEPFLDLTGRTNHNGERGLLSLAFDPNYQTNGLVYAYYTNPNGNIEVDEFATLSDTDADESSRRPVITIPHPGASNHNGGTAVFGPDRRLYLAPGDGGGGGDPRENAQDKRVLLGKMLRINPHRRGGRAYTVPRNNPFVGKRGRNEIYALGLRNPFRFSFDRLTGNVAIGDVGQDRFEEIDYETPKSLRRANFGWDHFEGNQRLRYPGDNEAPRPRRHQRPILTYGRDRGQVITGGVVVRDETLPTLHGRYLYSDFSTGQLRSLVPRTSGARGDRPLGVSVDNPSSFWSAPDGTVYITAWGSGELLRLVPEP
jgi:glucose/arabinose dehydrogenase